MAGTPPTVPGAPAPVSSLALGTARDPGAATAALGTLGQGSHPAREQFLPKISSSPAFWQWSHSLSPGTAEVREGGLQRDEETFHRLMEK